MSRVDQPVGTGTVRDLDRCHAPLNGEAGAVGVDRAQASARTSVKLQLAALGEAQFHAPACPTSEGTLRRRSRPPSTRYERLSVRGTATLAVKKTNHTAQATAPTPIPATDSLKQTNPLALRKPRHNDVEPALALLRSHGRDRRTDKICHPLNRGCHAPAILVSFHWGLALPQESRPESLSPAILFATSMTAWACARLT